MSLITRLNEIFSPKVPQGILGLSIQQQAISCCAIGEGFEIDCQSVSVTDGNTLQGLQEVSKIKGMQGECHLVLSAKNNQLVQADKPSVPQAEINGALKWQIKDLVTIAPENMIVDYFDAPKLAGGIEKINVVCTMRDQLASWLEAFDRNKVAVKSITIEEFAFASLMPVTDEARLLVCQQPNEDMLIVIVKKGSLYFQRRLRGLAQIAQRSEQELDMTVIDNLSLEIQRSTDYFERQLKQAPIKGIDILVPMKNEAYLARRLAENATSPVNLFVMPDGFSEYRAHAASIGATRLHQNESGA